MQSAAVHHLHSFNQFLQHDLSSAVDCALPHECAFDGCHERLQVMLQMTAIAIDYPILNKDPQTIITPRECRERKITYSAPMTASFKCGMNGIDDRGTITRTAGYLPQECDELGGYFIINGLEKVLRLIQVYHMSSYHHCQSDQQFGNLGADAKHANGNTATCVQRTRSLLYPVRFMTFSVTFTQ